MAKSCGACGKFLAPKDAATCSICAAFYHKACVSLSEAAPASKGWVCPACTTRTRKGDNTPVRAAQDAHGSRVTAHAAPAPPAQFAAPRAAITSPSAAVAAPARDLRDIHRELADWMGEMREFRREMAEFRASFAGLSSRVDAIESRLEEVERKRESPTEVADLRCKVALLQQELNDRDQDALLSDIEIGQLPEEKGESIVHTVTVLAAKLGVALDEREIVFAERVGVAQVAGAGGAPPSARRVVVRLARRHVRDQLLQAARVRRTLTAADAGRAAASAPRIFLNERLSRTNRQVFHRVREEARRLQWKYVWTKRGRVYARQGEGKQAFPIRSEADLSRVFGIGNSC